MSLDDIEIAVKNLVHDADYLVGHAFKNDRAFLSQCGYFKEIKVFDTIHYSKLISKQEMSLERMLNAFDINHSFLHNAGNDAFYTLNLLQTINTQPIN